MPDSTTSGTVARCGIYEDRPQVCKDYPKVDHYILEECTYKFLGEKRSGDCECNVGACCNAPREGGEPGGAPIPYIAGGRPCKHLVWEPRALDKEAGEQLMTHSGSVDLHDLVDGFSDS
jgi:hypothetical protein